MRVLLTGSQGTVGGAFRRVAAGRGIEVHPWNRAEVPPDEPSAVDAYLKRMRPDAVLHLAMGAPGWAAQMAGYSAEERIPFVFTSTVSVFAAPGPHGFTSERTATDEYGRYKADCEDAVSKASTEAVVVRLGYQIDPYGPGNNLAQHLREQAASGVIKASAGWIPATSILSDTVNVLLDLLSNPRPGLHHLDANSSDAWTYPEIVAAIGQMLGERWGIETTNDRVHDQRLLNSLPVPALSATLPLRR
ncbi:MAG: sugar nucleotide-binding protein [Candidatus Limnocylindrus sp.]